MFGEVLGEDQDVVEVDGNLPFAYKVAEDVVHHPLECGGRVHEPKEHDSGLKESSVHVECGLLFVAFLDPDVVVSPMNIELGEVLGSAKFVNEVRNEW